MWGKVIRGKYERNNLASGIGKTKVQDSSLWKNLINNWDLLGNLRKWIIGNGEKVRAWKNCWVDQGLILKHHLQNESNEIQNTKVAELIDTDVE